jgi:tetratricopeptide (TPR) repeat protein
VPRTHLVVSTRHHRRLAPIIIAISLLLVQNPGVGQITAQQKRDEGIALYKAGRAAEAVKVLQQAVKANQEDYEAWHYLGLSLIDLDEPDLSNATKSFEKALLIKPSFAMSHAALSYALLLKSKLSGAMAEAQRALELDAKNADAHYVIGVVSLTTDKPREALQEAEDALKLNPQLAVAYLLKSQALVNSPNALAGTESDVARSSRYQEAASALEQFLQLSHTYRQRETWKEQLNSLQFYAASYRDTATKVHLPTYVTTKARIFSKPEPQYTEEARSKLVTGRVIIGATFGADGTVSHLLVVKDLPCGLTERSMNVARQIKFTPALIDGRPVSTFIRLEYNFKLF